MLLQGTNMPADSVDFEEPPPFIKSIRLASKQSSAANGTHLSSSLAGTKNTTLEELIESASTRVINHRRRSCSHLNPSSNARRQRSHDRKFNCSKNAHVEHKSMQTNNHELSSYDKVGMTTPLRQPREALPPQQRVTPPEVIAAFYVENYLDLPRTDYTYSPQSRYYRTEIRPGIPALPVLRRDQITSRRPLSFAASSASAVSATERLEEVTWWRKTVTTVVTTIITTVAHPVATVLSSESLRWPTRTRSRALWLILPLLLALLLYLSSSSGVDSSSVETGAFHVIEAINTALNCFIWMLEFTWAAIGGILSLAFRPFISFFSYLSTSNKVTLSVRPGSGIEDIASQTHHDNDVSRNYLSESARLVEVKLLIENAITRNNMTILQHLSKEINQMVERLESIELHLKTLETRVEDTNNYQNVNPGVSRDHADSQSVVPSNPDNITIQMIKSMLETYHADRTGRPDFALQSNGGVVLGVRCTKTYKGHQPDSYFSIPWFAPLNGPDTIIKPGIMPGECWAFEGAEGYVDIGLAMPVYITAFTLEHTPKVLTPRNDISSAPKRFSVWGIDSVEDDEMIPLGRFEFKDNGESMQTFDAEPVNMAFKFIELKIESNHGNLDYTCLYRFRVHGRPVA